MCIAVMQHDHVLKHELHAWFDGPSGSVKSHSEVLEPCHYDFPQHTAFA